MCGISGFIDTSNNTIRPHEDLERMIGALKHRGPDDTGRLVSGNVSLGFVRLSIIDLSHGHQPIANEDESVFIIFNGEIYNFQELRGPLEEKGHRFKTNTDTEVILHLYEEHGVDCLKMLRGMFGFVIYDSKKGELFCARDRFGIKPFYYYIDKDRFAFASEIKAITALNPIDRSINFQAMDAFLAYGYTIGEHTIYNKIKKLRPAHYLKIPVKDPSNFVIKKYWEVSYSFEQERPESYWCDRIRNSLEESVKMHMISDVPLGAFLSGGIDSGGIVAMMSKLSGSRIKTFSIGFPEKEYSELSGAKLVAKKYDTDHHEMIVEKQSVELLSRIVDAFDEPFGDSSAIPTYLVSQFASQYVKVALSGDGGDELFGGYVHHKRLINFSKYSVLMSGLHKAFSLVKNPNKPMKLSNKYLYYFANNPVYLNSLFGIFTLPERLKLYRKDHLQLLENVFAEDYKYSQMASSNTKDYLSRVLESDINSYLVDDIMTKADITSMQNSIELRVPYLDHVFAEDTFKIPSRFKIKEGQTKYILRQALKDVLPQENLASPKKGFELPLKYWFKDDLRSFTHDTLLETNAPIRDIFDVKQMDNVLKNNSAANSSSKIWNLIILNSWLKKNQA